MNNKVILLGLGILLLILISSYMLSSYVEVSEQENIYGVWKGGEDEKEFLFRFNSDGTCVLSFKNNASGSVEMLNGDFEMDFSKKPLPLTIRNIPQLDHPLHTIVEFTGNKSIEIAPFAARWRLRPISFDADTSMNLKRVVSTREKIRRLP